MINVASCVYTRVVKFYQILLQKLKNDMFAKSTTILLLFGTENTGRQKIFGIKGESGLRVNWGR